VSKLDENLLLMLVSSEYQRKNDAGRIDALERLVTLYPKPPFRASMRSVPH